MLGLDVFRRKPRQFEYRPLHYDPQKEAREQRRKELLGEDTDLQTKEEGEYRPGSYIRSHGMSRKRTAIAPNHAPDHSRRARNIRRGLIALLLLFLMLIYILITS